MTVTVGALPAVDSPSITAIGASDAQVIDLLHRMMQ